MKLVAKYREANGAAIQPFSLKEEITQVQRLMELLRQLDSEIFDLRLELVLEDDPATALDEFKLKFLVEMVNKSLKQD